MQICKKYNTPEAMFVGDRFLSFYYNNIIFFFLKINEKIA